MQTALCQGQYYSMILLRLMYFSQIVSTDRLFLVPKVDPHTVQYFMVYSFRAARKKGIWIYTQGDLASKFPISIRTLTQGQYRCQKVRKILKNHVPVSDFATMLLNLRKTQKSQNFCKNFFFLFFVKKCNLISKKHFSGCFFPSLIFAF